MSNLQWNNTDNGVFTQGQNTALSSSKEYSNYGKDLIDLAQNSVRVSPQEYFSGNYAEQFFQSQKVLWDTIKQLEQDKIDMSNEHNESMDSFLDRQEKLFNSYSTSANAGDYRRSTVISTANSVVNSGLNANNYMSTKNKYNQDYYLKETYEQLINKEKLDPKSALVVLGQIQAESKFNPINEKQFTYKNLKDNVLIQNTNYITFRNNLYKHFGTTNITKDMYNELVKDQRKYFNLFYNNRLGNNGINDGYTYRGRGLVQLTGKGIYASIGKALNLDLLNNPELVNDPRYASSIAIEFMRQKGLLKKGISQVEMTKRVFGKVTTKKLQERLEATRQVEQRLLNIRKPL